jgi:hypothetical protein
MYYVFPIPDSRRITQSPHTVTPHKHKRRVLPVPRRERHTCTHAHTSSRAQEHTHHQLHTTSKVRAVSGRPKAGLCTLRTPANNTCCKSTTHTRAQDCIAYVEPTPPKQPSGQHVFHLAPSPLLPAAVHLYPQRSVKSALQQRPWPPPPTPGPRTPAAVGALLHAQNPFNFKLLGPKIGRSRILGGRGLWCSPACPLLYCSRRPEARFLLVVWRLRRTAHAWSMFGQGTLSKQRTPLHAHAEHVRRSERACNAHTAKATHA